MRCRRVQFRYTALVGDLPTSVAAELQGFFSTQPIAPALWRPRADVVESASALVVTLEIAGVAEDQVEVALYADALVITGRRECAACESATWHESEIRYGPFRFEMLLPDAIDSEKAEAKFDRGLLRVVLPKAGGVA